MEALWFVAVFLVHSVCSCCTPLVRSERACKQPNIQLGRIRQVGTKLIFLSCVRAVGLVCSSTADIEAALLSPHPCLLLFSCNKPINSHTNSQIYWALFLLLPKMNLSFDRQQLQHAVALWIEVGRYCAYCCSIGCVFGCIFESIPNHQAVLRRFPLYFLS